MPRDVRFDVRAQIATDLAKYAAISGDGGNDHYASGVFAVVLLQFLVRKHRNRRTSSQASAQASHDDPRESLGSLVIGVDNVTDGQGNDQSISASSHF